jgi:hypothetical protein
MSSHNDSRARIAAHLSDTSRAETEGVLGLALIMLSAIKTRCEEVVTKRRGGMDADALAQEILDIIQEGR